MAEQIPFLKINFGDSIQSIAKLKEELKATRKEFENAKPNTEAYSKFGSEIKRLESTIKTLNSVTKENTNALGGVNTATKFASGSYGELKQKIDASKKSLLELNVESREFADEQANLISLQEQRIAIESKIPSLFQERVKGAINEANALKELKAELKAAQALALNGDGAAAKRVAELKDKIDDLKDSTVTLQGSGVERLNTSIGLLTEGFANFDADALKTAFKGIGSAMSAIPIFALIEGFKLLKENWDEVIAFAKDLFNVTTANEEAIKSLTEQIESQKASNILLNAEIANEIKLMEAQGASTKDIIAKKKELMLIQLAEQKQTLALQLLQKSQKQAENDLYESVKQSILNTMGFRGAAIEEALEAEKKKQTEINKINEEIAKTEEKILNTLTDFKIAEIKKTKDAKKQEAREEKATIDEVYNYQFYTIKKYLKDKEEQLIKANHSEIEQNQIANDLASDLLDQQLQEERNFAEKKNLIYQLNLLQVKQGAYDELKARKDLLHSNMDLELQRVQSVENAEQEIALIKERYRQEEKQIESDYYVNQLDRAIKITNALGGLSDSLFEAKRANLKRGSEEDKKFAKQQFYVNKAFAIATSQMQAAQAIINASATTPFLPAGLAAVVVASALGASNLIKIASQKFEYYQGGYTGRGNPRDVSTNLGSKPYVYHKDEYVVPSNVLNTPKGGALVSNLEAMRKGYSPSGISGFFDGGFTSRQVSKPVETTANQSAMISDFIANIPAPVVRVSDINDVSRSKSVAVNVSSL